MEHGIRARRHLSRLNFSAQFSGFGSLLFRGSLVPGGEIEMGAAFPNVAGNEPGNRRDAAVPRPVGLVGMTIAARAAQTRSDLVRRSDEGFERSPGIRSRVGPLRLNQLDRKQEGNR